MKLFEKVESVRALENEQMRLKTASALKIAMNDLLPGLRYMVFGSLVQPRRFHRRSDVDVALFAEVPGWPDYRLLATLESRLGRPVDVVLLPDCRFREKILREGELWTNSD